MAVFMIALAGIRKKKGVASSMGLLILLAVAMFNVGITLLSGINTFYDNENEYLQGPHYVVRFAGNDYREDYLDYFINDPRVESVQAEEVVLMDMAAFPQGGVISLNLQRIQPDEVIKGYTLEKLAEVPEDEAVYIPIYMKSMGLMPGDTLTLRYNKQDFSFKIAGYSQSTWLNSSVMSLSNFYMPDAAYEKLYAKLGSGILLSARLHDSAQANAVNSDFKRDTDVKIEAASQDASTMSFSIADMRSGSTLVVTILSAVLFAFSFLMVVVVGIVIRFRILNHIELQMHNIGVLEAMGYTGKQVKWSIALEFLIIGITGTLLGIGASYGIIGALGGLISSSVGVTWRNQAHLGYDMVSGLVIMSIVFLVTHLVSSKASKILPVQALRGGVSSHSFLKTCFPLEKWNGSLSNALGLKNVMFNKKMYSMIGVIFAGVTFACAFALIIWLNMGVDDSLVLQLTGFEISDILIYTAPHADYEKLSEDLNQMEGIRKTSLYEAKSLEVEGELLTSYVSDDYNKLEMVETYEGSFPQYDNEIVVTGVLAKSWNKKIGDTIEVEVKGSTARYVICGLAQTMNNFGRQCFVSLDGMRRLDPHYKPHTIQIYLEPGVDIDQYIGTIESKFKVLSPTISNAEQTTPVTEAEAAKEAARKKAEEKLSVLLSMYGADSAQYALMVDGEVILSGDTTSYTIDRLENNRSLFVSNVDSIADSVNLLAIIILAGTAFIIILVLYMVIKSMIVRQKKELGIYKALGYTDRQLMKMIAVSFMPSVAAGTLAGSLGAGLSVNRLASSLFGMLGISKMELNVNILLLILMGIVLAVFAYGISMAVAGKLKSITVYGLLAED